MMCQVGQARATRALVAVLGVSLGLAACGSLSYTVDNDVFQSVTVDKKIRLFDAENDISISFDEREQIRERIRELKQEIRIADRQMDVADREVDRAEDRRDPDGREVAMLARTMWHRRIEYLEDSLDYLRDRLDVQDQLITVAMAKFELAKAVIVKRNKMRGASDLDVKDFERQVQRLGEQAKAAMTALDKRKAVVEKSRNVWLKVREELAASSLEAISSPGADEVVVWESW